MCDTCCVLPDTENDFYHKYTQRNTYGYVFLRFSCRISVSPCLHGEHTHTYTHHQNLVTCLSGSCKSKKRANMEVPTVDM
jgi:dTDP-4-dehydrorhamnose 3,5-epimerase-like enzyme